MIRHYPPIDPGVEPTLTMTATWETPDGTSETMDGVDVTTVTITIIIDERREESRQDALGGAAGLAKVYTRHPFSQAHLQPTVKRTATLKATATGCRNWRHV